jgi:predicted dithiol-disulfide oxidoreductase (DUF899 family)
VSSAEIDVICRQDHRRRQLPPGASCGACGITWLSVLFRRGSVVSCHQCAAIRRGCSGFELHHLGGHGSELAVLVPMNVHSVLTLIQEMTWRSDVAPGCEAAIERDIEAFLLVGAAYLKEVEG